MDEGVQHRTNLLVVLAVVAEEGSDEIKANVISSGGHVGKDDGARLTTERDSGRSSPLGEPTVG